MDRRNRSFFGVRLWPRQVASGRKSWRLQITLEGKRHLPISSPIRLPPDKHASTCRARVDLDRIRHVFVPIRKIFSVLRRIAHRPVPCLRSSECIDRIVIQMPNTTLPQQSMKKSGDFATTAVITRLVRLSSRYSWPVILGFLLVAIVSAGYFTRHFVITTDSNKLLSSSLPWRQQEVMLDLAFPQRIDRIIAVIDATTPEAADNAADALVNELSPRSEVIRTISRVDGGEFFERNGILFLTLDEVRRNTAELIYAHPFLGTLSADPTLRGVFLTLY